ncbi:MAG: hypothetical protein ABJZ80_08540 [Gilvibacter sp.]
MHRATAILFIFLYMVAMLRPIQPYVEYMINQDYIVEFLCDNKAQPELQCNGKCYLVKQLEKQEENNPKSLRVSLENYPIGFVNIFQISSKKIVTSTQKSSYAFYEKSYHSNYNYSRFQPPDFV